MFVGLVRETILPNFIASTKYPLKRTTSLSHLHSYSEEIRVRSRQSKSHRCDEDVTFKNRRGKDRVSYRHEYDYDELHEVIDLQFPLSHCTRETDCKKQRAVDLVVILRCGCRLLAHPPLYFSHSKTGFWKVTSSYPRISSMHEGKKNLRETFWHLDRD